MRGRLLFLSALITGASPFILFGLRNHITRGAWSLGCSDFDFFTFWGITTHPWHSKGPRIWKLAKKKFQLHPWPVEIFGKNRKMHFFVMISKFNFNRVLCFPAHWPIPQV
jgi:hypothetical protein